MPPAPLWVPVVHNRYQDFHVAPALSPECPKLKTGGSVVTGQWPPISSGYWKLQERAGLRQIEVTLLGFQPPIIELPAGSSALRGRLAPLLLVASTAAWRLSTIQTTQRFGIQLHDENPEIGNCLQFDAEVSSKNVLLPDPYALGSHGYQQLRDQFSSQALPPWRERLPIAFWRGASTGTQALTLKRISKNLRYKLCQFSLVEPSLLDARFTAIVQSRDTKAKSEIQQHLMRIGLLKPHCKPWIFGLHQFLIEIDGNVNSWGLLWKLLSGSCILKVDSLRRQWYHHKLKPYVHFIPIAKDLSNLGEQLDWCRTHPQHCEKIAVAGQALALKEAKNLGQSVLKAVDCLTNNP